MKKLKLDFESIQVDSFDTTTPDQRPHGTVHGRYVSAPPNCELPTDLPCQASYGGDTCDSTCYQLQCTCTYGGDLNGTCDINTSCNYYASCAYQTGCYDECG